MDLRERISAFVQLGDFFRFITNENFKDNQLDWFEGEKVNAESILRKAEVENPWFTQENIRFQIQQWGILLNNSDLEQWVSKTPFSNKSKKVGIVMAGNLPMVGFHDLLSVVLSGNLAIVKPSSKDKVLFDWISDLLFKINPELKNQIKTAKRLKEINAIIATGSNNTARYFESYFKNIPRIIRKNRTSVAILTGNETEEDLKNLGKDVFQYFGLGCRNVTQLFVPKDYDLKVFFEAIYGFKNVAQHNKYMNNYTYHRAIYLMNQDKFLDNNFVLLKESDQLFSPISTLYYSFYENESDLKEFLNQNENNIQCKVGFNYDVNFGETQQPKLNDYADGVDTMQFLSEL